MKGINLILIAILTTLAIHGQDITGQWHGTLDVQGTQLNLVFKISKIDSGYSSTMDSPDQGAYGIPVTSTSFKDSTLRLVVSNAKIEYEGILGEDDIVLGNFKQVGRTLQLDLTREKVEKAERTRPQEPKTPYPYLSEEVKFQNVGANLTLAGTLTLPKGKGPFPAVILISGSGPQNRNEELLGHKPFLVISDHLTKQGIAVLRYDDRGFGESTGNFAEATTLDFSKDVESAISFLNSRKDIDNNKIGLIGHSEGGIIAPLVAARSKDVGFIVLLAGSGIRGDQLLLLQGGLIERSMGKSEKEMEKSNSTRKRELEIVMNSEDPQSLRKDLQMYLDVALDKNSNEVVPEGMTTEQFITAQVSQISTPWMMYFVKHDPALVLEKVSCPVLAVNGEKDLQVPPKENLTAIGNALKKGGNNKVTIMELQGLNHLFQECETGSPFEYGKIEQTFSPIALEEISNWILKLIN
ncbi:alpha/beta fold hydrolase [Arenibacter sp. M-2]|uniref:alpha/beta hydrolase family protein n=1 Tax=Arenibacter sp. M-2 TaxID=3053612 RepID=UPI00256FE7E8|nr:alpha/beta hydrolase [Arenibacter sp. M-2]MDL5514877.1 alpha/beta fold hydrolase [Arenibacter sp. M-2]